MGQITKLVELMPLVNEFDLALALIYNLDLFRSSIEKPIYLLESFSFLYTYPICMLYVLYLINILKRIVQN